MITMQVVSLLFVVALSVLPVTLASGDEDFPHYTGDEYNELFATAPLDGLGEAGGPPEITGDKEFDSEVRSLAERRGYRRRPLAEGSLETVDGIEAQATAIRAWRRLRAAAEEEGHALKLTSGYRSIDAQRSIFVRDLSEPTLDEARRRLDWVAPPGYSKHHTGYAFDITETGYIQDEFGSSPGFEWLSADNNHNAKRFGFIPSYPPDATTQGPKPEPWEWTYVGVDTIRCGGFNLGYEAGVDSANPTGTIRDLATCPDLALTRGAVAHYLSLALELPPAPNRDTFRDDDGTAYEDAIERLHAADITNGCRQGHFCPKAYVTRAEVAGMLVEGFDLSPTGTDQFRDDDGSPFEDAINRVAASGVSVGCNPPANDHFCPDERVTRSQLLTLLERAQRRSR